MKLGCWVNAKRTAKHGITGFGFGPGICKWTKERKKVRDPSCGYPNTYLTKRFTYRVLKTKMFRINKYILKTFHREYMGESTKQLIQLVIIHY